jgi:hypothetical protein
MIYVQKFKIAIDKEDKSKNMRQRNRAMKYIINNTAEGHNNHDLSLTHILPHKQPIKIYHQNIRSLRKNK